MLQITEVVLGSICFIIGIAVAVIIPEERIIVFFGSGVLESNVGLWGGIWVS